MARSTLAHWMRHRAPRNSAALAFYTLVTLAPVLVVVVGLAGTVFEEAEARERVVQQFATLLGDRAAEVVRDVVASLSEGERGLLEGIVGVVAFLVGSTAVFSQLQDDLNAIFGIPKHQGRMLPSLVRKRLLSFAMVLGMGLILVLTLSVGALVSFLSDRLEAVGSLSADLVVSANVPISLLLMLVFFAVIYWVLPDADLELRDAAAGALVTTVLFGVGRLLIATYLGHTEKASPFGAAGSVVVFLLWIYYSSLIFFLGAELTREYATRRGQIEAEDESGEPVP